MVEPVLLRLVAKQDRNVLFASVRDFGMLVSHAIRQRLVMSVMADLVFQTCLKFDQVRQGAVGQ
jgi:hypothetical protein